MDPRVGKKKTVTQTYFFTERPTTLGPKEQGNHEHNTRIGGGN